MKDYRALVSRMPPEGLLEWARKGGALATAGFLYEKVWVKDTSIGAVLSDRVKKVPEVEGVCSACGNRMRFDYISSRAFYGEYRPSYGFLSCSEGHGEPVNSGYEWICPSCGSQVQVKRKALVGRGTYVTDQAYVTSASVLEGEKGKRPLVLTQWRLQRKVDRDAGEQYSVEPVEAYVFEEKDACKLKGWVKAYSGNAGYFMQIKREWSQPKKWSEEMGTMGKVFGLTEELVEESCLSNCKLDLFMETPFVDGNPVAYLRLYQQYPQVENLVVQGCGNILARIFEEMEQSGSWEKNKSGRLPMPPELHLEEKRPAQMLGLNKEELRCMVEQKWDIYHWRIYVKAKAAGDRLELPGDITLLHRYGAEDAERVIGMAPLGKCLRYVMRQLEIMGRMAEETDPEEMVDEDWNMPTLGYLADYWRMAQTAGWDLEDPKVRWPHDLFAAHDGAAAASRVILSKEKKRLIRKRAKELAEYSYASRELEIYPAKSQEALNKEGEKLQHCVARYGEDIAEGITAIFFVRHTWAPTEPYFTLEYKEGKVAQNRGYKNCARTQEVKAFEKEWLDWIAKGRPRDREGRPIGAKPVVKTRQEKKQKKEANVA